MLAGKRNTTRAFVLDVVKVRTAVWPVNQERRIIVIMGIRFTFSSEVLKLKQAQKYVLQLKVDSIYTMIIVE